MNAGPVLAPDAAMVLGIASTAIPFARTREDEAERWLRVLRLHGEVGIALQGLGVSEVNLDADADADADRERTPTASGSSDAVVEHAARVAERRGAPGVTTTDVLIGVMHVYGDVFDRVLRAHGTDHDEVLQRLGIDSSALSAD
jgi:hypothetical protein